MYKQQGLVVNVVLTGWPFSTGSSTLESIATPIAYNGVYGTHAIGYDFPGTFELNSRSADFTDTQALLWRQTFRH